jgi:signal transduction histidine kinase
VSCEPVADEATEDVLDPAVSAEVRRLQAQVRDLAALLALPGIWRGRDVDFIAGSLLDALVSLLRVDCAYLRLEDTGGGAVLEECRPDRGVPARELGEALGATRPPEERPPVSEQAVPGRGILHVLRIHPRIEGGSAVILVASARPDFPTELESFLIRAAVDQGLAALEGSRLLHDLQEANQAKATFLATMSHELRTPLNAILGYVDLLDAEVAGPLTPVQKQGLGRVRAGSLHLQDLIEGILGFARLDAGKEQLHSAPVELCALVHETAALVEPLARARGLDYAVHTPAAPITLTTDAGKLRQIILNLLSNAVKFTPAGGVTLALRPDRDRILLAVEDTGIGIAPDEHERIFEPFRQVGNVYTEKNSGTGLGLSVSRHLARLLGGDVTLASAPGEGSRFTLSIPATPAV